MILSDYFYCHFDFYMGAMLSSPWAVSGVFLVPACGSCTVKSCIFWSLRLLKFILSRLSVFIFILYCCIVYVLIVKVSNRIKSTFIWTSLTWISALLG